MLKMEIGGEQFMKAPGIKGHIQRYPTRKIRA